MTYEQTIILRVNEETKKWLDDVSYQSGVSMSRIVRLILDQVKIAGKIEDGKVILKKEE